MIHRVSTLDEGEKELIEIERVESSKFVSIGIFAFIAFFVR